MTIEEAAERYRIPAEILKEYESWGLCSSGNKAADSEQCGQADIERLSLIMTLRDVGFSSTETERYIRLILSDANTSKERTLTRLKTDYLDLYIIHRFDYETPIEETMSALNDLVKAGKVRALGASAMYGYQFADMQLCARDNSFARFETMENHYNLLYREDERELIPICKQTGVSLMPYSPLAAGHLTRPTWDTNTLRSRTDRVAAGKYDHTKQQDMQIVARVAELAEKYGVKIQEIALSRLWTKSVASPIVGAIDRNPPQGVMLLDEKK